MGNLYWRGDNHVQDEQDKNPLPYAYIYPHVIRSLFFQLWGKRRLLFGFVYYFYKRGIFFKTSMSGDGPPLNLALMYYPIDDNLRRYLINYGAFTRAPADSFNDVKVSDGYALCRYPPEYQVTDYLYARSNVDFQEYLPAISTYIGFVAVSSDQGKLVLGRRDIIVCWRGTTLPIEWFQDILCDQVPATDIFPDSKALVHYGFYNMYTAKDSTTTYNKMSVREQVLAAVRRLVDKYYKADPNEVVSITVIGHSLGAALATLNAVDRVANGYNKPTGSTTEYSVASFVFASPRVGDKGFLDVFSGLKNLHLLRIRNAQDFIPDLPPKEILGYSYADVGAELDIDTSLSPYIKKATFMEPHDLNLYCHGISGYQGKDRKFKLAVDFDLALVNKYNDLLLDDCKVPPKWWSNVMNKGMAQMDDGSWKLHDYVPDPPSDDVSENGTK
ncbi:triacylglycerol lipase, putative [Ricinus communis]|uniref:Phospholipase A1 n=1 Tax=Ricinus communis TaxID=3988 RepID=B9S984_RICCO|nr:triacylglycerol lipase, putative [Ricinus communis]